MRKYIIMIVLTMCCFNIYAWDDLSEASLKGPVKKVTETFYLESNTHSLYYGQQPGGKATQICWYDSEGRLTEKANYINGNIEDGYVRQYTINNVCMEYNYDAKGLIKGTFAYMQLDSDGHKLSTRRYKNGHVIAADSTVYDAEGHQIKCYESLFGNDSLILRYTYKYDSIGRISRYYETWAGTEKVCVYEYFPNGSYTEHVADNKGKKWDRKYTLDNKGQQIKYEDKTVRIRYSNFDKYGNWLKSRNSYTNNAAVVIYERVIEYYE